MPVFPIALSLLFSFCFLFANPAEAAPADPLDVVYLQADHLSDPIQLDSARPQLSWRMQSGDPAARGKSQRGYQVLVASSPEKLDENVGDLWDSGRVESDRSQGVAYGGKRLKSREQAFWKVRIWDENDTQSDWSPTATWTMGLLSPRDWARSEWIGIGKDTRTSPLAEREFTSGAEPAMKRSHVSPLLRQTIDLAKPVKRALAHVAGVGYNEFYVNGAKVGDAVLDPGQTNYETHTLYVTHDVSELLQPGTNALGIWLGSGFFGQNVAWKEDFDYGQPRARAVIHVEYQDGTQEVFGTDNRWRATPSPIVFDNVYWGETYDARLEIADWSQVGCDDSSWQRAVVLEEPCSADRLRSQLIAPIRVKRRMEPAGIKDVGNGKYIIDFGENLAGWVEIALEAAAGDVITMLAGEKMEPDGVTVNTRTTGGAPGRQQEMIYVAKGEGLERWSARFSYHGFQYIEVSGLRTAPTKENFTAELVFSDLPFTGSFVTSEPLINRQWDITKRTLEANWHSIPEDCPAREKCGWLGDAHATSDVSFYGHDMTVFLSKFLRDIEDSLRTDARYNRVVGEGAGIPPLVAPGKRVGGQPGPIDWSVAYLLVAWDVYLHAGDDSVIERHYKNFKNFIAYYESMRGPGNILPNGLGDWCPPLWDRRSAPQYMLCHPHVSGTAFYFEALRITAEAADRMNDRAYAAHCRRLADDVKEAFNKAYLVDIPGTNARFYGSQTATIMALKFGMVPEDQIEAVVAGLVHDIEKVHEGHHAVGIHGLRHIYTVLADFGHEDLVARMLLDRGFPGPGYLANYGFSTWPERQFNWDKEPRYRNSMNHPMQGGFSAFFFEGIGGIRPLEGTAGYKRFELRPRLTGELDSAEVVTETAYGRIESSWKEHEGKLRWSVTVPANTQAIAYLPTNDAGAVSESGKPLADTAGLHSVEVASDRRTESLMLTLGSGTYHFELPRP